MKKRRSIHESYIFVLSMNRGCVAIDTHQMLTFEETSHRTK